MLRVKRIVGFGASSAQGVGDTEAGGYTKRLAGWMEKNAPDTTVINLGIGGHCIVDMLKRVATDVAKARPDFIIFLSGINDVPRGDGKPRTPLEVYREQIRELLRQLAAMAPTLYVTPFVPNCEQLGMDAKVLEGYINAARGEAKACGLAILDLPTLIPAGDLPGYWQTDGLHFNPAGHELIFRLLRDYLVRQYGVK